MSSNSLKYWMTPIKYLHFTFKVSTCNRHLSHHKQQDSLFMAFELCEKGCIMDVSMDKETKPLSIDDARNFFAQMILGIEYLHENNICHRDIKPDNMMISKDGILKIVDFGVSEIFKEDSDKLHNAAGSPGKFWVSKITILFFFSSFAGLAFYSPESCQANHGDLSGKAADLWALGVTLYCLVFGKLPFTGSNVLELYETIKNKP